ncbi:uncharacterized protein LOC117125058 [Anneissia japonica]|uniref:uncharacterized protein LOC117125058 n=1 Tax=Anneissia japonica TaxID=1529436 RepID=UPI0014258508|nr:uncharacterized protein LOC117125058 [Anneissia japonica]
MMWYAGTGGSGGTGRGGGNWCGFDPTLFYQIVKMLLLKLFMLLCFCYTIYYGYLCTGLLIAALVLQQEIQLLNILATMQNCNQLTSGRNAVRESCAVPQRESNQQVDLNTIYPLVRSGHTIPFYDDPVQESCAVQQPVNSGVCDPVAGASNRAGFAAGDGAATDGAVSGATSGVGTWVNCMDKVKVKVKYDWLWFEVLVHPDSTIGDLVQRFSTIRAIEVRDRSWNVLKHDQAIGAIKLLYFMPD